MNNKSTTMSRHLIAPTFVLATLVLTLGACNSKSEDRASTRSAEATQTPSASKVAAKPAASKPSTKSAEARPDYPPNPSRVLGQTISYETDSAVLTDAAVATLQKKVDLLKNKPELRLEIQGHADERGSTAYNYELGLRRARAAKSFFVKAGIGVDRLSVRSFGESKPLLRGDGRTAWAENRRSEFVAVR